MPVGVHQEFNALLDGFRAGDSAAAEELITLVYQELRLLAHRYLKRERTNHTLQTTALINEVFGRLFGKETVEWQDRDHFFVVVAQEMRRVLVDYARKSRSDKRGGSAITISLDGLPELPSISDPILVALDDALRDLEHAYPRESRVVELRFFGGLTEKEIAVLLDTSLITVKRDWQFAKAWLFSQLSQTPQPDPTMPIQVPVASQISKD